MCEDKHHVWLIDKLPMLYLAFISTILIITYFGYAYPYLSPQSYLEENI